MRCLPIFLGVSVDMVQKFVAYETSLLCAFPIEFDLEDRVDTRADENKQYN